MPTGALIVNGKRSKKRRVSVAGILAAIGGKKNPKRNKRRRSVKRHTRRNSSKAVARRNLRKNGALLTNGRKRSRKGVRKYKFNRSMRANGKRRVYRRRNGALLTNGYKRNRKGAHRNPRRNGALLTNRRHRKSRRNGALLTNPGNMLASVTRPVGGLLSKIPVLGKNLLAPAFNYAVGALPFGVGAVAMIYGAPYVAQYLPPQVQVAQSTILGAGSAAAMQWLLPANIPGKKWLVMSLPVVGIVLDVVRAMGGNNAVAGLGGDWGDVDEMGSPLSAHEYGDASLCDAENCPDYLDDEEVAAAAFGRAAFWYRFRPKYARHQATNDGNKSHHAGVPGRRFGWLIYVIGFDNFRQLAQLPRGQQVQYVHALRQNAAQLAHKMLSQGIDPSVAQAASLKLITPS